MTPNDKNVTNPMSHDDILNAEIEQEHQSLNNQIHAIESSVNTELECSLPHKVQALKNRTYSRTAEYVTSGHIDRTCDLIASSVIDAIVQKDGANSHSSIECSWADDLILISGEAITTLDTSSEALKPIISKAVERAGYTSKLRDHFTKEDVLLIDDVQIISKIHHQSPDIQLGTETKRGWNDQCIAASGAINTNATYMPLEHTVAKDIGEFLFENSYGFSDLGDTDKPVNFPVIGPDIKTLATIEYSPNQNPKIKRITVAAPMPKALHDSQIEDLKADVITFVKHFYPSLTFTQDFTIVVNGTGKYTQFGAGSDSSTTGRKLAVNQTGTKFPIGGGSLAAKSYQHGNPDLYLPFLARYIAVNALQAFNLKFCQVELAVTIGQQSLDNILVTCDKPQLEEHIENYVRTQMETSPDSLVRNFRLLETKNIADICFNNFFGNPSLMPWERADIAPKMYNAISSQVKSDMAECACHCENSNCTCAV